MAKLAWGRLKDRKVETGVSKAVLYANGGSGVVWNGIVSIASTPDGAEDTDLYANNNLYGRLRSAENYQGSIEAYQSPEEFGQCDGSYDVIPGLSLGQQKRAPFNLCYRTEIFNSGGTDIGYKIHLIYNARVSPADKSYETLGDSPDAVTFSWDFTTTPIALEGYKAFSEIILDSTTIDWINLKELEKIIYGYEDDPVLPTPEFILNLVSMNKVARIMVNVLSMHGHWIWDDFNFLTDTVQSATEREALRHVYKTPAANANYIQPSIAYKLIYADANEQQYSVEVIDNKEESGLVTDLESSVEGLERELDGISGLWSVKQDSKGFYHYPYILTL